MKIRHLTGKLTLKILQRFTVIHSWFYILFIQCNKKGVTNLNHLSNFET